MSNNGDYGQVGRLAGLFMGSATAHGRFYPKPSDGETGKIGGRSDTVREATTDEMWSNHIQGVLGLGIIPICDDSSCHWGCIDIDIYPLDFVPLLKRIKELNLPLTVCKSKSGGAHLFVFLNPPATARAVQTYLRGITATLGIAGVEVFPKQTTILIQRGDVGNWLNMPYFGNTRRGIILDPNGNVRELDLIDFLNLAYDNRINLDVTEKNAWTSANLLWSRRLHAYKLLNYRDFQKAPVIWACSL